MKGKNIVIIVVIIMIISVIGVKIQEGRAFNKAEEHIVACVKDGKYYSAVEEFRTVTFEGGKISKKVEKLVADSKLYMIAQNEIELYKREINLERMEQALDKMTGSYKKYDNFTKDVQELEERIDKIEGFREEVEDALEQAGKLKKAGREDEAYELLDKYYPHEDMSDLTIKLNEKLAEMINELEPK